MMQQPGVCGLRFCMGLPGLFRGPSYGFVAACDCGVVTDGFAASFRDPQVDWVGWR
jgi:hypothetical protein